jgi:hypothetical protein
MTVAACVVDFDIELKLTLSARLSATAALASAQPVQQRWSNRSS